MKEETLYVGTIDELVKHFDFVKQRNDFKVKEGDYYLGVPHIPIKDQLRIILISGGNGILMLFKVTKSKTKFVDITTKEGKKIKYIPQTDLQLEKFNVRVLKKEN